MSIIDKLKQQLSNSPVEKVSSRPELSIKDQELKENFDEKLHNNFNSQEVITTVDDRPDTITLGDEFKEQHNPGDKIDGAELHDLDDHVKPHGIKEDYILLDTFSVRFEKENHLINPDQIFKITKPEFDIINSQEQNEIKVTFTVINSKHFFGRPTELTNFRTDQEIIDLAEDFNQNTPEWIEFTEYGDNSDLPRITTRYWGLKITKINFSDLNTQVEGMIKYYTATITYDRKSTTKGEFNDPID